MKDKGCSEGRMEAYLGKTHPQETTELESEIRQKKRSRRKIREEEERKREEAERKKERDEVVMVGRLR